MNAWSYDDLRQLAVRLVLDAHAPLFLHDLPLALEARPVDLQRRHAVGLEPQHQRQELRRHRFPEDGHVLGRVGVAPAADARNHRGVLFRLHVLRALEHQVLEQVGEARAPGSLVLRADVIPHLRGGRWASSGPRRGPRSGRCRASGAGTGALAAAPRPRAGRLRTRDRRPPGPEATDAGLPASRGRHAAQTARGAAA